ncbi:hypothetical protein BDN67DRAFT_250472 [Paxillus ammoniavirescens]|nr:hypothetical protein BDN67DRAFT_250472 [Paxillus ammoniavirescens]
MGNSAPRIATIPLGPSIDGWLTYHVHSEFHIGDEPLGLPSSSEGGWSTNRRELSEKLNRYGSGYPSPTASDLDTLSPKSARDPGLVTHSDPRYLSWRWQQSSTDEAGSLGTISRPYVSLTSCTLASTFVWSKSNSFQFDPCSSINPDWQL